MVVADEHIVVHVSWTQALVSHAPETQVATVTQVSSMMPSTSSAESSSSFEYSVLRSIGRMFEGNDNDKEVCYESIISQEFRC